MSIEATASALATDTALPEQVAETTPELTEDDELSAIFDRRDEEPEAEAEPEQAEQPEETEAEEAPEPVKVEAPSELPKGVRDHWGTIPEEARTALLDSQREMNRKLGEQGRLMQGIAPIRDVLVEATRNFPQLANMTPDQVAKSMFETARMQAELETRPVESIMGFIKQRGLEKAFSQALAGQQPQNDNALRLHIQKLERQLQQVSDPDYLRNQVAQITTQSRVQSDVEQFAQTKEHWGAVESHMPAAIQFVKTALGESASPQDVLTKAYELAVSQLVPEARKAPQTTAAQEAATPSDPEKTKAALKAKSVNVKSQQTGKARTLSEDEELELIYSRMQS